ncbi:hypothetical protein VTJ83DRAFT_5181 [Remersonia thermophila]|uniref:Glucose receptor Git3 N-terminal domain-containing protein n=1 Tax=Remersonia thermophila TaxID=72144 RepID=A0ABR4DD23_9PEZI
MKHLPREIPLPFELDESIDNILLAVSQTGAALGFITVAIVAIAYALIRRLRSQVATLVVLVSISNAIGSVAVLATHGDVHHGDLSLWYQAQGFLFDIFSLSSAAWALTFSIHTLLVFTRGPRPRYLRRWGWIYCAVCYAPPFAIAVSHTKFKQAKHAESRSMFAHLSQEETDEKFREAIPFQMYPAIWGCIVGSMIVYAAVGVSILWDHRTHRATLQEALPDAEKGKKNSILSLSGWPLSQRCRSILTDSKRHSGTASSSTTDDNHDGHVPTSRPLSYPPAVLLPDGPGVFAPEATWLATFACAPPPPPPEKPPTSDPRRRVYLRAGLLLSLSLVVTWLPGTIHLTWRGLHKDQDSPVALIAVNAVLYNIHGVWIGVVFFGGIGAWRDVKDVLASGRWRLGRIAVPWRESLTRRVREDAEEEERMERGELPPPPTYSYGRSPPAGPSPVHLGGAGPWESKRQYAELAQHEEPKELDSTPSPSSPAGEGWNSADRGSHAAGEAEPGKQEVIGDGQPGYVFIRRPTSPPPGYI